MIQITFTPGNSAQADLIGKLMAQYIGLAETDLPVVEPAPTAEPAAPKATRARKPAADTAATQQPSTASSSASAATTATAQPTEAAATAPSQTTATTSDEGNAAAASSAPEATAASPASSSDSSPATKTFSLEEVRAKLAEISKAGKQTQVVALIASLGAKKLTDVPAEKYAQLMTEAEAL